MTNRELYLAISELREKQEHSKRTVEQYLLALLGLTRLYKNAEFLSVTEFYFLITKAFTASPLLFEVGWQDNYPTQDTEPRGFDSWESTIIRQIVDLREMDARNVFANEYCYFGITAPRGSNWYNFDALTYLECGMAGAFGGWEPGDSTGRILVPGDIAILDHDGNMQSVNPEDVARPVAEIAPITWELFTDFIECGRFYE